MAVELEDGKIVKVPPLTIDQHMLNLEVFIGDMENLETADDSTVDTTEAAAAFDAMELEIKNKQGWVAQAARMELQRDRFRTAVEVAIEYLDLGENLKAHTVLAYVATSFDRPPGT